MSPKECAVCKNPNDFDKQCSGSCSTCGKNYMCEQCCYTHPCVHGKGRQLLIIANPAWICNLMKTLSQ
jgi:hypothetical protein